MTDAEFLDALGIDLDEYAFSERVSIKLDGIQNPTQRDIDQAREQALKEMMK